MKTLLQSKWRLWTIVMLAATACSSPGTPVSVKTVYKDEGPAKADDAFSRAVLADAEERAFDRLENLEKAQKRLRTPASEGGFQAELEADLGNSVKGFEVWVFPKVSNIAKKTRAPMKVVLKKPVGFKFSSPIWISCGEIGKFQNAKYVHQKVFPADLDPKGRCGVIVVKRSAHGTTESYSLNPKNFAMGDIVEMRVYIDSHYRGYAMEILTFTGERVSGRNDYKQELAARLLPLDPNTPISSGLTLFPVDLPVLAFSEKSSARVDLQDLIDSDRVLVQSAVVSAPNDKKINDQVGGSSGPKRFVACGKDRGFRFEYADLYGNKNTVGWCKGDFWPSVIENNRFVAVRKQ